MMNDTTLKEFPPEFSSRLRFEPVTQAHFSLLDQTIFSDDELMQNVYPREQAYVHHLRYVKEWQVSGYGFYTLFNQDTQELVGRAGIFWETKPEGFEIGYTIARKFWRQGYAQEACCYLLDYVAVRLGAKQVQAMIKPTNMPSILLAEKLGFRRQHDGADADHQALYRIWKKSINHFRQGNCISSLLWSKIFDPWCLFKALRN